MNQQARSSHSRRGFSLMELIVTIVVIGILASLAIVGFRAVVDRSTESKQQQRMTSLLKEARVLYVQKIYQDPSYTWQRAIIDATADLPTYKTDALSNVAEGVSATGGSNLNTGSNGWTLEADTGQSVYSTGSSELVFKEVSDVLYVSSSIHSSRAVFGMVSEDSKPYVWSAECAGSSCDAESATTGVPASGAYAPGTTVPAVVSYSVGDTGPGGGVIFAVFATPFSCGPTMNLTCTYLEAAPDNWYAPGEDPTRKMSGYTMGNLVWTNDGLGYGYQNTLTLIAQSSAADFGITLADSYSNNGKSDWFLPSKAELVEFCKYARQQATGDVSVACNSTGTLRSGIASAWWWSSSAASPYAWRLHTINGSTVLNAETTAQRIRPVRAG